MRFVSAAGLALILAAAPLQAGSVQTVPPLPQALATAARQPAGDTVAPRAPTTAAVGATQLGAAPATAAAPGPKPDGLVAVFRDVARARPETLFDGLRRGERGSIVAATSLAMASAILPTGGIVAEAARLARKTERTPAPTLGTRKRTWETTRLLARTMPIAAIAAFVLTRSGPPHAAALPLAVAGLTSGIATFMADELGRLRSVVVGGWQASHDQRYRVGPDGQLRDVRGRRYGEDRYDLLAPGIVGDSESSVIRVAANAVGLIILICLGAAPRDVFLYNLSLGLLLTGTDLWRRWRHPEPPARPVGPVEYDR